MAARLSPGVAKLVEERVRQHPFGAASEIAASLELDGIKVSTHYIQQAMKRVNRPQPFDRAYHPEA